MVNTRDGRETCLLNGLGLAICTPSGYVIFLLSQAHFSFLSAELMKKCK